IIGNVGCGSLVIVVAIVGVVRRALREYAEDIVARCDPGRMIGSQRSLVGILQRRHLSQRQIFGEALGRKILVGAAEDGEKGSACGIGTAGAAIEVGGNTGPRKSMLQQAHVLLG